MKWPEVLLGDLFDISSSKRVLQRDWKAEGVPFYRAREIVKLAKNGYVENDLFITEEHYIALQKENGTPKKDDLMISAVGTLGACYLVGANDRFYYKDASVLRFSPKTQLCSKYFVHAFRTSLILDQVNAGGGATVGTYTIERAKKTKISLPPLAEQQRIAALLDAADRILKQRESAIAKLDQLAQSIFVDIFKNEKDIKKVSDLFSINMNKLNINLKDEDDVAFIPMAAVSEKSKVIVDHQTRKFLDVKKGYTPIANGDLIVAKITPCYENGKMAIANLNFGNFAYGSTEFHTFRSNNPKLISYLHYFLMNEQLRISGAKSMKGAAGQRRVPSEFFAELKIASPSIKSLNSFCDTIFEIDSIKSKSAIAIEQCKKLILSLQHQSFAVN